MMHAHTQTGSRQTAHQLKDPYSQHYLSLYILYQILLGLPVELNQIQGAVL